MTLQPGIHADILLQNQNINSGTPYGFLLVQLETIEPEEIGEKLGKNASQTRTLGESEKHGWTREQDVVHFFSIGLGDGQTNPGGSRRTETRKEDLNNLLSILSEIYEITLITKIGAYSGLKADGHAITITDYDDYSIAAVRLLMTGKNFKPAEYETWLLSTIVDETNLPATYGKVFDETSTTVKGNVR